MKKILCIICVLAASVWTFAETPFDNITDILKKLDGSPKVLDSDHKGGHLVVELADSCQVEMVSLNTNEIMLIYTSCAPICSSCVRIYRVKEKGVWEPIGERQPDCGGVFPQAFWENGQLIWRDNTPAWLDDEEKKQP